MFFQDKSLAKDSLRQFFPFDFDIFPITEIYNGSNNRISAYDPTLYISPFQRYMAASSTNNNTLFGLTLVGTIVAVGGGQTITFQNTSAAASIGSDSVPLLLANGFSTWGVGTVLANAGVVTSQGNEYFLGSFPSAKIGGGNVFYWFFPQGAAVQFSAAPFETFTGMYTYAKPFGSIGIPSNGFLAPHDGTYRYGHVNTTSDANFNFIFNFSLPFSSRVNSAMVARSTAINSSNTLLFSTCAYPSASGNYINSAVFTGWKIVPNQSKSGNFTPITISLLP
jgi:hypothetical protein